ncbi:hypothetical protein BV20DRAFT_974931 [Pilatotrama ljubarskyi]|nr:hypothetical protein BV20DRAFT_974931 [Pilatotrama ljubarskyi]
MLAAASASHPNLLVRGAHRSDCIAQKDRRTPRLHGERWYQTPTYVRRTTRGAHSTRATLPVVYTLLLLSGTKLPWEQCPFILCGLHHESHLAVGH